MNNTTSINTEPFSIYSLPRPFRIAFLFSPDESKYEIIDSIIEYNSKVWGGRFNPIIPIVDENIPDNYWHLLQFADPDIIYLFDDITEETKLKIIKKIQPLQIVPHRNSNNFYVDLSINQVTVDFIIKKLSSSNIWDRFRENIIPVSNGIEEKDRKLHNLIFRNFCIEDDRLNGRQYSRIFKTDIIRENDTIENFFLTFNSLNNYIFPIQLCAIDINSHFIRESYLYEKFCIIIEESIWSYILLWNRPLFQSSYIRNKVSQLCLPISLFQNSDVAKNLAHFIQVGLRQLFSGQNQIDILSTELLNSDQKKKISEFCYSLNSHPNFIRQDPFNIPKLNDYPKDVEKIPESVHQKVDKLKTNLDIAIPQFFEKETFSITPFLREYNWMIDYKIEYKPEMFRYTNINYWWILSKRQNIARLFFHSSMSRVNNAGLLSLRIDSNKKDIELNIPTEYNLFYSTIVNEIKYEHKSEKKVLKPYYEYFQTSDKGRYLLASINLFGNAYSANFIFESNFWRTFFEDKCKVNTQNDIDALRRIKNKILKHIDTFVQNYSSGAKEKQLEWLSRYILKTSKELKAQRIYFKYKELEESVISIIKEFPEINSSNEKIYLDEFKNTFDSLLSQSVFLQGIMPRCNVCGSSFWYELQELSQNLKCKGCNSSFQIPFDIDWTFKINELIVNSISYHGVFPVISCINELYHYCKNLIFHPALDLYLNAKEKEEVDLVLLMDNKLAVCEVKTHIKEFDKKEIEKIKRIANNVEADKIVLAGFYGERAELEEIGNQLKTELNTNEIEVLTVCPHETVFENSAYF